MTPSAAAQALIDRLATEDREGTVERLATTPLDDQDTAVCHALEHGWDAMAALVFQKNPDLVQDHREVSPWSLRPRQKLLWLLTWSKGNRQSAEVLLASQKPFPPQWDCIGMSLRSVGRTWWSPWPPAWMTSNGSKAVGWLRPFGSVAVPPLPS